MFGPCFPMGPLVCIIMNVFVMHFSLANATDAWRRPQPVDAEPGPWVGILQLLSVLGSLVNVAVMHLALSDDNCRLLKEVFLPVFPGIDAASVERVAPWISVSCLLLLATLNVLIHVMVNDRAAWVDSGARRDTYQEMAEREWHRDAYLAKVVASTAVPPVPRVPLQLRMYRRTGMVAAFRSAYPVTVDRPTGTAQKAHAHDYLVVTDAFDRGSPNSRAVATSTWTDPAQRSCDVLTMPAGAFEEQYEPRRLGAYAPSLPSHEQRAVEQVAAVQYHKKAVAAVSMPCDFERLQLPLRDERGYQLSRTHGGDAERCVLSGGADDVVILPGGGGAFVCTSSEFTRDYAEVPAEQLSQQQHAALELLQTRFDEGVRQNPRLLAQRHKLHKLPRQAPPEEAPGARCSVHTKRRLTRQTSGWHLNPTNPMQLRTHAWLQHALQEQRRVSARMRLDRDR